MSTENRQTHRRESTYMTSARSGTLENAWQKGIPGASVFGWLGRIQMKPSFFEKMGAAAVTLGFAATMSATECGAAVVVEGPILFDGCVRCTVTLPGGDLAPRGATSVMPYD